MNITEKIIARASNRNSASPGDVVFANVDKLMIHDVSGPGVIKVFEEWSKKGIQLDKVWNADKIWIAEDHFVPSADRISAENISKLTKWAEKFGIKKHFKYGLGQYGICHTLSHERGLKSVFKSANKGLDDDNYCDIDVESRRYLHVLPCYIQT